MLLTVHFTGSLFLNNPNNKETLDYYIGITPCLLLTTSVAIGTDTKHNQKLTASLKLKPFISPLPPLWVIYL